MAWASATLCHRVCSTHRQASDKAVCANPSPYMSIYPRPTYAPFNFGFKANTGVRLCSVMELKSYTGYQSSCPALCIRSDMRLSLVLNPSIHCYRNSRGLFVHPWASNTLASSASHDCHRSIHFPVHNNLYQYSNEPAVFDA
jgi:hypothetical protein